MNICTYIQRAFPCIFIKTANKGSSKMLHLATFDTSPE